MKYPAVSTAAQPKNPALQNPSIHLYMHRKHEGTMRAFREQPAYIAAMKSMKALTLKQITVASHVLQINDEYFNDGWTQTMKTKAAAPAWARHPMHGPPQKFVGIIFWAPSSKSLA
mmetsp:Transcript_7313/g.14040  ORF Transcript_7313/g.14040 Transcript_7313/m.14040 type:complete len:116 (+) Transcript_7313:262-609(+)